MKYIELYMYTYLYGFVPIKTLRDLGGGTFFSLRTALFGPFFATVIYYFQKLKNYKISSIHQ